MRAVVQRVSEASVSVDNEVTGAIESGIVVFLGVESGDNEKDISYVADKVANLRIFEDDEGKMNLSVSDVGGSVLAISQFTLFGDVRKGKRPSFISAARPEAANESYEKFVGLVRDMGIRVETGVFQADMKVKVFNDGPVTILIDSKKTF